MRHRVSGTKLGSNSTHKRAIMRNLATSVIMNERIVTTEAKAKELRSYVERLVTQAKKGGVHARRLVARKVFADEAVTKLFEVYAPRFAERHGGYMRIYKVGFRPGDAALKSLIEFMPEEKKPEPVAAPEKGKGKKKAAKAEEPAAE